MCGDDALDQARALRQRKRGVGEETHHLKDDGANPDRELDPSAVLRAKDTGLAFLAEGWLVGASGAPPFNARL